TTGTKTNVTYTSRAGPANAAISIRLRIRLRDLAGPCAGAGPAVSTAGPASICDDMWWTLQGLDRCLDGVDDVLRRALAAEEVDDRLVHGAADHGAVGRVEPQLDVRRVVQALEHHLEVRVGDRVLRGGDGREARTTLAEPALNVLGHDVLQQLDGDVGRVRVDREGVAAAEGRSRVTAGAGDAREVEPAEELRRGRVLVTGLVAEDAAHDTRVPVAHELHRGL